jgi:hypothetical protein
MLERDELRIKAANLPFGRDGISRLVCKTRVASRWADLGCSMVEVRTNGFGRTVPGMKNATQYTELGKACRVDLFVAFMGAIETWDIPHTLLENGLIDDVDAERIWLASSETEAVRLLKAAVTRSYHFVCAGPRTIN